MRRIGEQWSNNKDVNLVRKGELIPSPQGTFGLCTYDLFEAYPPGRRFSPEPPCLMVWLHAQDDTHLIDEAQVAIMAKRLDRRLVCMAPNNPKKENGYDFFWAFCFDKQQNNNDLGFVNGQMNHEVCNELCGVIQKLAHESLATRVVIGGYSMGGFGGFHLGAYKPELFDVVFSIGGHGAGTLLPSHLGYKAPQPHAENVFNSFVRTTSPGLARIPFVLAIHAEHDVVSSYHDVEVLMANVRMLGGEALLVTVPEDKSNSDLKKSKQNHGYVNFAIQNDTSESAFYGPIRAAFMSERCFSKQPPPPSVAPVELDAEEAQAAAELEAEMAAMQVAAQAAAQAKLMEERKAAALIQVKKLKETALRKRIAEIESQNRQVSNEEAEKQNDNDAMKKSKDAVGRVESAKQNPPAKKIKSDTIVDLDDDDDVIMLS